MRSVGRVLAAWGEAENFTVLRPAMPMPFGGLGRAMDWSLFDNVQTLGLSAGASAPECLVEEFLTALAARRTVRVETIETAREDIVFNTPLRLAS